MPNIKEYDAPVNVIHPGNEGFSSWETAGRRLGSAYNQVAQDIRTAGRLQGDTIRSRLWPFDVLRLYEDDAKQSQSSPVGFRVRSSRGGRSTDPYADYAQTSRGAADLSSVAREMALGLVPRTSGKDVIGGSTQVNPDGTVTPYYESDELAGRDRAPDWGDFTLAKLKAEPNPDPGSPQKEFEANFKQYKQQQDPDRQLFQQGRDVYGRPVSQDEAPSSPSTIGRLLDSFKDYVTGGGGGNGGPDFSENDNYSQ